MNNKYTAMLNETLSKDIRDFIWNRIEHECFKQCSSNKEYTYYSNKHSKVWKELSKVLSKDILAKVEELLNIDNLLEAIREEILYKQGLIDGMRFFNTLFATEFGEVNDFKEENNE